MWNLWLSAAFALRVDVDTEHVFREAPVVVTGEVLDLRCEGGDRWHTVATLLVEAAEGPEAAALAGAGSVEITLGGGECFGITQIVEHEARLGVDRRYALARSRGALGWRVFGGDLGAVELRSPTAPHAPERRP